MFPFSAIIREQGIAVPKYYRKGNLMTIENLSQNLDKVISEYEADAGKACSFCSDLQTGDALSESHKAISHALSRFKAEIITYLMQQNI